MENGNYSLTDLKLYIGIDVHKKNWSVSIFSDAAHHLTFCQPPSATALKNLSGYKKTAKLLRTIPGIGPLTTVEILCEIEDIVSCCPEFTLF